MQQIASETLWYTKVNILEMQREKMGKKKTYASFIISKELQDALITVKKKTAFPKCHCASLQLNEKSDIKIPYVITSLFSLSTQWHREER